MISEKNCKKINYIYVYVFSVRVSVSVRKSEHFFFSISCAYNKNYAHSLFLSIFYFKFGNGESRYSESTDSLPRFFNGSTSYLFLLKKLKLKQNRSVAEDSQ